MHDLQTTIVAIATAPGASGLGCVRLSGPEAFGIAKRLVRFARPVELPGDGRPRLVTVVDAAGDAIDRGFVVPFPAGRSYTAEPTVELWTHGSPPVLAALVEAAVAGGAVAAGPGEFTYRALRHGRLDLARAEAVGDLVAARTLHQARTAFAQMEGALSRRLAPLEDLLVDLIARGEAAVEFADEAEVHLAAGRMAEGIARATAMARGMVEEARAGRVLREGARVALTGVTSVGKSSLFNRLLGRDRAIVSSVPGTTRDTLEETVDLAGVPVTLVDTAGLREVVDAVEAEGVRRAVAAAKEADAVVIVLDATRPVRPDERDSILARNGGAGGAGAPVVVVANKIDRLPAGAPLPWPAALGVSALTGAGIPALRAALGEAIGAGSLEHPALTNVRHANALTDTLSALEDAAGARARGLSDEAALEDLKRALAHLGTIRGEVGMDAIYERIFSTFCIGK